MDEGATQAQAAHARSLTAARAEIAAELGKDGLAALHRENAALDALTVLGAISAFLALAWLLGTGSAREPWWWACFFLQGNMVLVMAMVNHDVFVHRKWLPPRLRWLLSSVLAWPSQLRSSIYEEHHLTHHRALGTQQDTELYKHGIDTPLRRILFASPAMLLYHLLLLRRKSTRLAAAAAAQASTPPLQAARDRAAYEQKVRWGIWALVAAAAAWDWRLVVFGYLLPLVFVMPLLNTVRIVLEHFDLDTSNPFWTGTFYRTGPLTRVMFWWIGGDCHVVHHFYANIPWYHLPRAIRLIRPVLLRHGVHEHRSLARLLLDWFGGRRPHWSVPATAVRRGPVPAGGVPPA